METAFWTKLKNVMSAFKPSKKVLIKGIVSVANLANKLVEAKKNKAQFIPVSDAAYDLAIDALKLLGNSAFEF